MSRRCTQPLFLLVRIIVLVSIFWGLTITHTSRYSSKIDKRESEQRKLKFIQRKEKIVLEQSLRPIPPEIQLIRLFSGESSNRTARLRQKSKELSFLRVPSNFTRPPFKWAHINRGSFHDPGEYDITAPRIRIRRSKHRHKYRPIDRNDDDDEDEGDEEEDGDDILKKLPRMSKRKHRYKAKPGGMGRVGVSTAVKKPKQEKKTHDQFMRKAKKKPNKIRNTNSNCRTRPCMNGGTCVSTPPAGYRCFCRSHFGGENCEMEFRANKTKKREKGPIRVKGNKVVMNVPIPLVAVAVVVGAILLGSLVCCCLVRLRMETAYAPYRAQLARGEPLTSLPPGVCASCRWVCKAIVCCRYCRAADVDRPFGAVDVHEPTEELVGLLTPATKQTSSESGRTTKRVLSGKSAFNEELAQQKSGSRQKVRSFNSPVAVPESYHSPVTIPQSYHSPAEVVDSKGNVSANRRISHTNTRPSRDRRTRSRRAASVSAAHPHRSCDVNANNDAITLYEKKRSKSQVIDAYNRACNSARKRSGGNISHRYDDMTRDGTTHNDMTQHDMSRRKVADYLKHVEAQTDSGLSSVGAVSPPARKPHQRRKPCVTEVDASVSEDNSESSPCGKPYTAIHPRRDYSHNYTRHRLMGASSRSQNFANDHAYRASHHISANSHHVYSHVTSDREPLMFVNGVTGQQNTVMDHQQNFPNVTEHVRDYHDVTEQLHNHRDTWNTQFQYVQHIPTQHDPVGQETNTKYTPIVSHNLSQAVPLLPPQFTTYRKHSASQLHDTATHYPTNHSTTITSAHPGCYPNQPTNHPSNQHMNYTTSYAQQNTLTNNPTNYTTHVNSHPNNLTGHPTHPITDRSKPANQSTNHSTNPHINHSVHHPPNHIPTPPTTQLIDHPTNPSPPTHQTVALPTTPTYQYHTVQQTYPSPVPPHPYPQPSYPPPPMQFANHHPTLHTTTPTGTYIMQ